MSVLAPGLLAALLSLPIPRNAAEPPAERRGRLALVAAELAAAVDLAVMTGRLPGRERRLWAAAAAATLVRESGNVSRAVHSGARLGDGGRSICLMQINRGNPAGYLPHPWKRLAGLDRAATRRCVAGGVRSLARMRAWCARRGASDLMGATLSAYMHGSSCLPSSEGRRRARFARQLISFLQRRDE